jgi:hypothetical protein
MSDRQLRRRLVNLQGHDDDHLWTKLCENRPLSVTRVVIIHCIELHRPNRPTLKPTQYRAKPIVGVRSIGGYNDDGTEAAS